MSIIELVIYIALLATFLVGSIFSAYSMLLSVMHDNDVADKVETKIDQNGGFAAIISTIIISTALLLAAIILSEKTAGLYDLVMRSEYRVIVRAHANACLDRALFKLSQDYFYTPVSGGEYVNPFDCSIDLVTTPSVDQRSIVVSSVYKGIHGRIDAVLQMEPHSVQILYQKFILF